MKIFHIYTNLLKDTGGETTASIYAIIWKNVAASVHR